MTVLIRPLAEADLDAADRIFRLAFGTFLGLPDPLMFAPGADLVRTRWRADPSRAFGAELDGEVVGSNLATNWGSFGFFGPLSVHPDFQNRGIGKQLVEPVLALFADWGVTQAGLYTFAHSAQHIGLYGSFGFYPRFLTAIMAKPIGGAAAGPGPGRYGALPATEREGVVIGCRNVTEAIFEGLDVTTEIHAVETQAIGDTVLVFDGDEIVAFAVCHMGEGSEAGTGVCLVKFGAVLPGPGAAGSFGSLLDACEGLALERGLGRVVCGVNLAREEAYRQLLASGYRTQVQGVAMQKPNEPGFNRPGVYVLDDWR
jgi:predicted N-acetyltransferase YhbS